MILMNVLYIIFNTIYRLMTLSQYPRLMDPSGFKSLIFIILVTFMVEFIILILIFVFSFKFPVQVGNFMMILLLIGCLAYLFDKEFNKETSFDPISGIYTVFYFLCALLFMIFPRIFKSKVEIENKTT